MELRVTDRERAGWSVWGGRMRGWWGKVQDSRSGKPRRFHYLTPGTGVEGLQELPKAQLEGTALKSWEMQE